MNASIWMEASVWLMFGMVIPATCFPFFYGFFFPWYRSPLGRALMTKAVGLLLLVDVSVLYVVFGDNYSGRAIVRFVVFLLVFLGLWYQFIVIVKIRWQKRAERRVQRVDASSR